MTPDPTLPVITLSVWVWMGVAVVAALLFTGLVVFLIGVVQHYWKR